MARTFQGMSGESSGQRYRRIAGAPTFDAATFCHGQMSAEIPVQFSSGPGSARRHRPKNRALAQKDLMLFHLQSKEDVCALLYALGNGYGLPVDAVPGLETYLEFCKSSAVVEKPQQRDAFAMALSPSGGLYLPRAIDFDLRFKLPAVAQLHESLELPCEIESVARMQPPRRYSLTQRLANFLEAQDDQEAPVEPSGAPSSSVGPCLKERAAWAQSLTEGELRDAIGRQFGLPLQADSELAPYLMNNQQEFALLCTFLTNGDHASLRARQKKVLDYSSRMEEACLTD
jgi:hypothetical protein